MFNFGGGMLTGHEIEKQIKKGRIIISPFDITKMNPNSYNLTLDNELKIYSRGERHTNTASDNVVTMNLNDSLASSTCTTSKYQKVDTKPPLDMRIDNSVAKIRIPESGYVLKPGVLYLGRTVEKCGTNFYIPMINGRSSVGRLGMSIHITAGFGDVGFDGTWTLEITVVEPLRVYAGEEVAQVCYFTPKGKIGDLLYNGRYNGQMDATPSRFYLPKNGDANEQV